MPTKIEWATETYNPVTGCTKISAGCAHCYAERMSKRLAGRFGYDKDDPFRVTLHPDRLDQPLRWRKPRRVFVCSMGDLFHEDVPFEYIDRILYVIAHCHCDTFMILTKRPGQMAEYFEAGSFWPGAKGTFLSGGWPKQPKPLPNLWLGVTAENQEQADKRIPVLLQIPAAVRFVSYEPGLGGVDLIGTGLKCNHVGKACGDVAHHPGCRNGNCLGHAGLDWVICGCENGPGARPMDLDWARSLRDQCQAAGVSFFYKKGSDGSRLLDGRQWNEYPKTRRN